jgi:spoIIIJ-associated protein
MSVINEVENQITKITEFMGIKPNISVEEDGEGTVKVDIQGNDLNFLIGYRGEALDALQTLLGIIVYKKQNEWTHIVVDINGYRKEKQDKIEHITKNYIDKVRFFGKEVEMSPMTSYERRQVHTFVADYDDVISESKGEGQARRVVLKPKS